MIGRLLKRVLHDQRSQLTVVDRDGGNRRVVYETRDWIEAPNWSRDGQWLLFNGGGRLFRIGVDGASAPVVIDTGSVGDITNDHLLSPDGATIYCTAGGVIHAVPWRGGAPRRVTAPNDGPSRVDYYVHGVSPDGATLVCTGLATGGTMPSALFTVPSSGGVPTRIAHVAGPSDGAEYSPDGAWIYFNGERRGAIAGHSQISRVAVGGSTIEQVTDDARVNWFPHLSPDGRSLLYLSYAPGTVGHPGNVDVELRVRSIADVDDHVVIPIFGGQGSLNANSWAPDSRAFAFVAYPRREHR